MPPKYAVIPAAGEGRRILPYSEKVPKPMIQVFDRPILAHVIARCKNAGISKIIIVVNPKSDAVKNYFQDGSELGVSIEYVGQPKPEGIGHAVGIQRNKKNWPSGRDLEVRRAVRLDGHGAEDTFEHECAEPRG